MKKITLSLLFILTTVLLISCTTVKTDTVKPVITITGGSSNIYVGDDFIPPTVIVTDNVDKDLEIVISGDTVNTELAGTYIILYNAVDKAGNKADEKSFTVTVSEFVDTEKPVITISGGTKALFVGDDFIAPIVTVTDNVDNDLEVVISGDTVNTDLAGEYTIIYNVTDTAGNKADQKTFEVTVYEYDESMEIINGGFETGDLTGWTILEIEGSSGAFKDEFVIDTVNQKEGTYFFDGSKTDDDQVGALQSSNFQLGGSGWINFRLGGGNDIDNLYLGVYRVSDDSIVAKFANTNPQKYGGNEFLVGYKFNLLTIDGISLGDEFYIKVVDTKLSDWAIIKLDDINTLNLIEPNDTTYEIATNQAQ